MASPYKGMSFGSNGTHRNSQDHTVEFPPSSTSHHSASLSMQSVPEPVTPPASVHSGTLQAKSHYFVPSHLAPNPQYSTPNVNMRDQRKPSIGYGSGSLASPIDTPRTNSNFGSHSSPSSYSVVGNHPYGSTMHQQQQQQLATPHTPYSMASVPSTPIGTKGPPLWTVSSNTTGAPGNATSNPSANLGAAAPPPYCHSRSYSYTPLDVQPSMSRLSISSASSSGSQEGFRPRAYSLGVPNVSSVTPGAPVPLSNGRKGSVNMGSTVAPNNTLSNPFGGPTSFTAQGLESSGSNPFPPPLSSPLSPDHVVPGMSPGVTPTVASSIAPSNHRGSYPYTFLPSMTEDPKSLHTSLTQGGVIGSGSARFPGEDVYIDPHTGRRASPPQGRLLGKSRRSSSGASSIDFMPLHTGNAGIARSGSFGSMGFVSVSDESNSPGNTSPTTDGVHHSASSSTSSAKISAIPSSSASSSTLNGNNVNGFSANTNIDILQSPEEQIYSLCRDQRGCRFLQRKLADADPALCRRVFEATHSHIVTLMMDPFGNYFCQKLFENCSPAEVTTLLEVSAPSLPSIAINQHGTRALQKLIDALTTPEQVNILISALDGHVVRLIRDLNGNHVIQKLLLSLDERGSQFIYDAACRSVVEIGSHRHGCCVLQRCLDYAQEANRLSLISHIVAQAPVLVRDPFGNYVCQYVIDLGVQGYTDSMVQRLLGGICELSVQKFSSNVVEKCFRSASPQLQRALLAEIMEPATFHELVMDNYGNYVIQTALESTKSLDPETKRQLAASIQTALMVTRSPYGRRIMSKLKSW